MLTFSFDPLGTPARHFALTTASFLRARNLFRQPEKVPCSERVAYISIIQRYVAAKARPHTVPWASNVAYIAPPCRLVFGVTVTSAVKRGYFITVSRTTNSVHNLPTAVGRIV